MKNAYLTAAIIGAALPYAFFIEHITTSGLFLDVFFAQGFANPVAAGFTTDLLISSAVFWIYMFSAGKDAPNPWAFVVINLLVGLSCALPAYLYWRERSTSFHTASA